MQLTQFQWIPTVRQLFDVLNLGQLWGQSSLLFFLKNALELKKLSQFSTYLLTNQVYFLSFLLDLGLLFVNNFLSIINSLGQFLVFGFDAF